MLTAAWQSVVCSESDQEFHPLLPTIVIFPEIFTPPFLCKAKTAALWLAALPSAGKNSLFVFMSIDNSWNLLVKRTKHYNQDHKPALKTCKLCSRGGEQQRMENCLREGQALSATAPGSLHLQDGQTTDKQPRHFKAMTAWVSLPM